jgi:predicted signal transduction protein with EAL and GGDEF domain
MWGWIPAAWNWAVAVIDLSLPDLLTMVCAISFAGHRCWKHRGMDEGPRGELLILDVLRGAAFASFLIVMAMPVAKSFMAAMYDHHRVTLFLAGFIGAAAVIKADKWLVEFFRR